MKWLLRGIFLIFGLFVLICGAGFFMPATQSVERSVVVDAYPEDIFPYLNDLTAYSQWSPLHKQIVGAQIVYGGSETGIGQTMAWQNGGKTYPFGSQEIVQSQPGEFVQLKVNLAGREATATHALLPLESGEGITVLTKSEIDLGGFPYLERVRAKMKQSWYDEQFDASLARLKTVSEAYSAE